MGKLVRTHVLLPEEVLAAIDAEVGPRNRSHFLAEAAEAKLRNLRQLEAFKRVAGSLEHVDIPGWETSESSAEWVRNLRRETERDPWGLESKG